MKGENNIIQAREMIFRAEALTVTSKLDQHILLQPFTVTICCGQWINIIGHNGSGKSTLAKYISGHEYDRLRIEGGEHRNFNGTLPIITQTTSEYLLGSTPYEDLVISYEQFGSHHIGYAEAIEQIASALHIDHLLHLPIEQLSGGERQLVAIAGCLMMETPLLILDEITSMLAPRAKQVVMQQIRAYCAERNIAVIWITQQLDELLYSDTVWVMDKLALRFVGSAQQLFEEEAGTSEAERLQLPIPWAVQKARELIGLGHSITQLPFNSEQLVKEVHTVE